MEETTVIKIRMKDKERLNKFKLCEEESNGSAISRLLDEVENNGK